MLLEYGSIIWSQHTIRRGPHCFWRCVWWGKRLEHHGPINQQNSGQWRSGQRNNPSTAARTRDTEALWDVTFPTHTTGAQTPTPTLIHHQQPKMDVTLTTEGRKNSRCVSKTAACHKTNKLLTLFIRWLFCG